MNKIFAVVIFFITNSAFSQNEKANIYSGGMLFLQPGYTIADTEHQNIKELNFGIGGILRFYFFEYFTTGIYGGTHKATYNSTHSENSYISLSYGGVFLGISRKVGNFRYTFSAFAGRGTIKNLHIESQNSNKLIDAYLYKKSTFVFSPIFSLDYAVSKRLLLTLQTVFLTAKFNNEKTFYNPALQIGILFNR